MSRTGDITINISAPYHQKRNRLRRKIWKGWTCVKSVWMHFWLCTTWLWLKFDAFSEMSHFWLQGWTFLLKRLFCPPQLGIDKNILLHFSTFCRTFWGKIVDLFLLQRCLRTCSPPQQCDVVHLNEPRGRQTRPTRFGHPTPCLPCLPHFYPI